MAAIHEAVTGDNANLAREAQRKQQALLDEQQRQVDAVEAGQRTNAQQGGGGLLAYVEQGPKAKGPAGAAGAGLRKLFG